MERKLEYYKEKYKNYRENSIVRNFYAKEANKGKSYRANILDSFFIVFFLFLILAILLANTTDSLILSVYISLITVYFITKFVYKIRARKEFEKRLKINDELKTKRVLREITQLNSREFIYYVKSILEKYYQVEFKRESDGVDLSATINEKKYAVKVIKSSMDDRIIKKKVDDFFDYIRYLDFDEGIIVTNSYFAIDSKDKTSLVLIDFLGIKEILKSIDEFPSDEEIKNYIIHRFDDRKKEIEKQIKLITFKKIVKLYGVFLVFYLISFFVRFTFYYRVVAVIAFTIATILGAIKITENLKEKHRISLLK